MARYKDYFYEQHKFIPVSFSSRRTLLRNGVERERITKLTADAGFHTEVNMTL